MLKKRLKKRIHSDLTALVFEESVLKLVRIDDDRVVCYKWLSIPSGLIGSQKVINQKKLSQLIKKLRDEAKPKSDRNKYCAIGIPENQIFIKTIEVPVDLTDSEISRTVEHRSDELFPLPYEDIILDWQVVERAKNKEGKEEKIILIIAAPGKLIKSLVGAVKMAGLEPLSVEPKSFSVHRLLNYILKKQSLILVDFEANSASLSIYQRGKIKFHTKISPPLTEEKVVGAISRTLHYYRDRHPKEKPISRVICSGDTGDKTFLDNIGSNFSQVQVEKITLPKLRSDKKFQERMTFFASAIALALNKINIFNKHQVINLLPTNIKNNHRVGLAHYYLGLIVRISAFVSIFALGILGIFNYKLSFDSQELAQAIEGKQNYKISASLVEKEEIVKKINRKSAVLNTLYQSDKKVTEKLTEIFELVPHSINLVNISYGNDSKVVLSGIGSRSDIIKLKDRLETSEAVGNISLPLSSLAKRDQSDFQIIFNLK